MIKLQVGEAGKPQRVYTVEEYPEYAVVGAELWDGMDTFEVIDRHIRVDGVWLNLQNTKTTASGWFRIQDCGPLGYRPASRTGTLLRRRFGDIPRK